MVRTRKAPTDLRGRNHRRNLEVGLNGLNPIKHLNKMTLAPRIYQSFATEVYEEKPTCVFILK